MSSRRDDEFTDYVATGLVPLQRVAYLLCQDRQRAEDLGRPIRAGGCPIALLVGP